MAGRPSQHARQHIAVHCGVAYHTSLAHTPFASLELWLDQSDDLAAGPQEVRYGRQHQVEADERDVDRGQIDPNPTGQGRQRAHVGAFEQRHAVVLAQLPGQLAVAHVDSINVCRAALQEAIAEAAGGGSDVSHDQPGRIQAESIQRGFQFQAAAADVGQRIFDAHLAAGRNHLARFAGRGIVHQDIAGHDQGARPFTALCQAQLDQQSVQALFLAGSVRHLAHGAMIARQRAAGKLTRAAGMGIICAMSENVKSKVVEAGPAASGRRGGMLATGRALLKTMRPKQWTKNVVVFAPLIFDEKLFDPALFARTLLAFALFCLMSSTVYIINDLADIEKDRQHPKKRERPLAAGALSPAVAMAAAGIFILAALPLALWLGGGFSLILFGYLLLNVAYSFYLKNLVIIDVLVIAAGFVLRVAGGVAVVGVERFSPWLYLVITLGALFLGFGKRRHELLLLEDGADAHRAILAEYTVPFLDQLIGLVTSTMVIAYSLYTFSAPNLPDNHAMMLTIPFVLYGLFRYLYLIHVKKEGGAPEELLLSDKPLLATGALWVLAVIAVLYTF
jgi:4-hydroxybenzoate polyprenyltransferase